MPVPVDRPVRLKLRPWYRRMWHGYRWARKVGGSVRISLWYAWKMIAFEEP